MAGGPGVHYARSGDVHVAYRILGSGPVDVLLYPGAPFLPMDSVDDEPHFQRLLQRLTTFSRLVQFDVRGVGMSDPISPSDPPTLEQWVDDALAVLDAAGCEQVALLAPRDSSLQAILLAASHPERVGKLIIVNGFARLRRADDYPVGIPSRLLDRFVQSNIEPEDEDLGFKMADGRRADVLSVGAPTVSDDPTFREWWERAGRRGASPATASAILGVAYQADVRPMLPVLSVPTLILHRRDEPVFRIGHGRYLAEHIAGSRFVELPGADTLYWVGDTELMLDEIEEFLAGTRSGSPPERVLATVLFSDIVDSTKRAAELGDRQWKALLNRHDDAVQRRVAHARGRVVKSTGDGCLATFDGPGRAISCAAALRDELRAVGLEIRVGVHTGEVERRGDDIGGIAVHIGARIGALAGAGEILTSSTVKDLVTGSGLEFTDRGEHALKGVPGVWRVFAVDA